MHLQVEEFYELPFDSEFEWRAGLFRVTKDLATESLLELVTKYKEEDHDVEWKDDDGLINFAFSEDLFEKLKMLMIKNAEPTF